MLKTHRNGETWCISQTDHGLLAGYLAAHWGNEAFRAPGYFAPAEDAERLRAEVVFACALRDNGWWEWEGAPELDSADGLPRDLPAVLVNLKESMDRWRYGVPRFAASHPYASYLIAAHAVWLYAARCGREVTPPFIHPLFWKGQPPVFTGIELHVTTSFLAEIEQMQSSFSEALLEDTSRAHWLDSAHLLPHVRMVQLLDGLSLWLCSGLIHDAVTTPVGPGENPVTFANVPRSHWDDRVSIAVQPLGGRRVALRPYPFAEPDLAVPVPVKVFSRQRFSGPGALTAWHAQPVEIVTFTFCAG